jgi:hypothetical protein
MREIDIRLSSRPYIVNNSRYRERQKTEDKNVDRTIFINIDVNYILTEDDIEVIKKKYVKAGWSDCQVTKTDNSHFSIVLCYVLYKECTKSEESAVSS